MTIELIGLESHPGDLTHKLTMVLRLRRIDFIEKPAYTDSFWN